MELLWWLIILVVWVEQTSQTPVTQNSTLTLVAQDVTITLNTQRPRHLTGDKFLSLSIPPWLLSSGNYSSASVNMLRGLAPAYLRIEGTSREGKKELTFNAKSNSSGSVNFTDAEWKYMRQLAVEAGLTLILSLNFENREDQNLSSHVLLLSQQLGYTPICQLTYKMPDVNDTTTSLRGKELGQDLVQLRKVVDSVSPSPPPPGVLGPDITNCDSSDCGHFLTDFLLETNNSLDVITLQMKPHEVYREEKVLEQLSEPVDSVIKTMSNRAALISLYQKQLWIAETSEQGYTGEFSDALIWALRLGHAASLGYRTILHRTQQLSHPTPDYWVSLLYRNLVGSTVLRIRLQPCTNVTVFSHCTMVSSQLKQESLALSQYGNGSVTVWGVNTAHDPVRLSLNVGVREGTVHLYTLTGADGLESELGSTFLNGQLLRLTEDGELPKLTPHTSSLGLSFVTVPPRSVFFIVFPDLKASACLSDVVNQDSLSSVNKLPTIKLPYFSRRKDSVVLQKEGEVGSNYTLEKGGLFESTQTVQENSDVFKNRMRSSFRMNPRDRMKEMINRAKNVTKLEKQPEEVKNNKSDSGERFSEEGIPLKTKTTEPSNDDWVSKLSKINSSGILTKEEFRTLSDLLSIDRQLVDVKSKQYSSLPSKIDEERSINRDHKMLLAGEEKIMETIRNKRSEDDTFVTGISKPKLFDTSPLYRRINLLRQKRPFAIFNTTPKSEMPEEASQETFQAKSLNKSEPTKPHKQQNSFKFPSTSENSENKDFASLQYLPGEFYETLGGLKLDSNISLRDVEDPHEAIASVSKESKCKDCNSKLKVSKKPDNRHHVDSKIIENATEQMKQYYGSAEDIKMKSDVSGGIVNDMKCRQGKKKLVKIQPSQDKTMEEITTNDAKSTESDPQKPSVHDLETKKEDPNTAGHVDMSSSRTKREITRMFKIKSSKIEDKEDSEERELTTLLNELTVEGEQLLKSVNQAEAGNKSKQLNTQTNPMMSQNIFTRLLPNGNKLLSNLEEIKASSDRKNSSDHSAINNLLNDIAVKQKRKYPNSKLTFRSIINLNENTKKEIKIQNDTNNFDTNAISIPIPKESQEKSKSKGIELLTVSKELNSSHPSKEHNDPEKLLETTGKDNHEGEEKESVFLQTTDTGFPRVFVQQNLREIPHTPSKLIEMSKVPQEKIETAQVTEKKEENNSSTVKNSFLTDSLSTTNEIQTIGNENEGNNIRKAENPVGVADLPVKPNMQFNVSEISDPQVLNQSPITSQLTHNNDEVDKMKDLTSKTQPTNTIDAGTLSTKLSALHRERIEAFKARLEKAKQRLFSGGSSKLVVKREIPLNTEVMNDIYYQNNGIEANRYGKNSLDSLKNNHLIKYLEAKMLSPLINEPDLTHRLARQIPDPSLGGVKTKLMQEKKTQPKDTETDEESKSPQANSAVVPTFVTPLNKWIIPLSNYTENIVLNNKVFPVKLYGILSDDWILQSRQSKLNDIIQDKKRVPRSIRYLDPCKRDRFNDFETEEQNDNFLKNSNSNIKRATNEEVDENTQQKSAEKVSQTKHQNVDIKASPILSSLVSQIKTNERSKRSVNDDIVRNQIEMKALLTNEIVKEGPLNDLSNDDHTEGHSEGIFKSMLHKTMLKAVSNNKTGLDKMYELAKQYQKTNPSSLETFNDQFKNVRANHDENEEENKAVEVTDNYEVQRSGTIKSNAPANQEEVPITGSLSKGNSALQDKLSKDGIGHSKSSKNDILTSFLKKVKEFFKVITNMVKKSFT